MCLLDRVRDWGAAHIHCTAVSHRAVDNPLRRIGVLRAAAGLEYAAQAIALHAALAGADEAPRRGYLASARDVQILAPTLDATDAPLEIEATRIAGEAGSALYAFSLRAGGAVLLTGRVAVVMEARAGAAPRQP